MNYAIAGIRKDNGLLEVSELFSTINGDFNFTLVDVASWAVDVDNPSEKSLYREFVIVCWDEEN